MTRSIFVTQVDSACGWFVIEDGQCSGALGMDEAIAQLVRLMLRDWRGYPMTSLDALNSALSEQFRHQYEEQRAHAESASAEIAEGAP